jgi:P4 family phage/plasmid primase-like protien
LTPVNLQAPTFLELLDPDAERFTFQTFDDSPAKTKSLSKVYHGNIDDMAGPLAKLQSAGAGVFVTVNATDLQGRKRTNVVRVRAVFVDLDGSPLQPVLACRLEPHIVIESSPDRYHAYWIVDGLPLDQFTPVQKAIIARFGGDKAVHDLPRVMRLPGFWHQKGEPFQTRVHGISDRMPYTAEQILAEFPPQQPKTNAHRQHTADSPFRAINDAALADLQAWVPALFPSARPHNDGYRISSADLGRDLEEDLSITPIGIKDFGVHDLGDPNEGKRTPIDLVIEHGGEPDAPAAAQWLALQLGIEFETAGQLADDFSHDGLALALGRAWLDHARHVALWGRWLFWTGGRGATWQSDERLDHLTRTRHYLRARADSFVQAATEGKLPGIDVELAKKIAKTLRSAQTIASVASLARSNPELAATVDQWDRNPHSLGTPAGTVDLNTGALRDAAPEDYITKITAVAPASPGTPAPRWQAFLERIFRHDLELIPFVQRALGCSLLGIVADHIVLFCWGPGGNGKGVLLNTAARIVGDFAAVAPSDLLLVTHSDRHPCDMAMLRGARLVTAQELARGRAWDEPKLKSLTGGDPITARFIRQDFFTYQPQFTLWVAGNTKPSFQGVDEAIRRRVLLVPFTQVIPEAERDPHLSEKLKTEWPAILRWMIDGCLAYQRDGLNPPASARAATKDYLDAEDLLGQWLDECCVAHPRVGWIPLQILYDHWCAWAGKRGHKLGTATALGKRLDERGYERRKREKGTGFLGLGLVCKRRRKNPSRVAA